jgi:DNA ligase-1
LPLRLPSRRLRQWAAILTDLPDWLVDDCYERVGDLAETAALLLPNPKTSVCDLSLKTVIEEQLLPLQFWDDGFQLNLFKDFWLSLNATETFVVNKLLTGGFRIGVSRNLLIRGLAEALEMEKSILAHRLMGEWQPTNTFFLSLTSDDANNKAALTRPYPFYLASPISGPVYHLGQPNEWFAEWKWDGIRGQLIKRENAVYLWSRGDESLTENFPEIVKAAQNLPDGTVMDGEIICWKDSKPLPFHILQTRIRRTNLSPEILNEAPAIFLAYDCMEINGEDIRGKPQESRRSSLESLLKTEENKIQLSPLIDFETWPSLQEKWLESRARGVEGMIFKRKNAPYEVGRVRGNWWKWKTDPYTVDLVLIYAQAGHGRRASLFTDYTLAAWKDDLLVPVAKAYSGLKNEEIKRLDKWIKTNTIARKGPVRTVPPHHVMEIAFEGIRPSSRHKSGLALRFPRILHWRTDKTPKDADSIENLKKLI